VLSNEKRRAFYDKHGTIEGVDDAAEAQEFMDEVFSMFFTGGSKVSPFDDIDDFIKILEADNNKRTRKMFGDLGKAYRPKGGRAGLAARKHQSKQMKMLEKQMMNDLMGGGMEEMTMMMAMMMGDDDMEQIIMGGKGGKPSKDEIKIMEQMFGAGKSKKSKSDDEWETDSEDEKADKKVGKSAEEDDGWETDSN